MQTNLGVVLKEDRGVAQNNTDGMRGSPRACYCTVQFFLHRSSVVSFSLLGACGYSRNVVMPL